MEQIETHTCFGGQQSVYEHHSTSLGCPMKIGVFLPPQAKTAKVPVLYWLSGLTCTEQNFITKAGAQRYAAQHGIALIAPDTSPRGETIPDDPAYDLGQGAGFYVNATKQPWANNYRMYDYVAKELPDLVEAALPVTNARSISGHSMGGHGALSVALKNPGRYRSVSAFSPIVAPSQVPWGQNAFKAYLGDDPMAWAAYDTVKLIEGAIERLPLLVDIGADDSFLDRELRPELLRAACENAGHKLTLTLHPSYDHSYYFVSSFIGLHIAYHAAHLQNIQAG